MTDKPDKFAGLRPKADDMDKPLFDHRHDQKQNAGSSRHGNHKASKSHKPNHNQQHGNKSSKPSFRKSNVGRQGAGQKAAPASGMLPKSNLPTNKPKTPSIAGQNKQLDDLPKRGEQLNSQDRDHKNKSDTKDSPNSDLAKKSNSDTDSKHDKPTNDRDESNNNDKNDQDDGQNNNKNDSDLTKDAKLDQDKDKGKDKSDSGDGKDNDASKKNDDEKGPDKTDQDDKKDDQEQEPQSPLKKLLNFVTGKKRSKNKSFKDVLSGEKKKAGIPKKQQGPISNLKDFLSRLFNILKRALMLLKLYFLALKTWLLMKIVALVQTIFMIISNIIQWVVNFLISAWTLFTSFFGTIGAMIASVFSLGALFAGISIVVALISGFFAAQQQDTELSNYQKMCANARQTDTGSGPDSVTKGSGSWKKKGTKQFKTAHSVFKSWVDLGLDGGAAAGIVGWVAHEGGDFSIIDRAEGHFGNTEKEAGISEGVVPVPSGNYSTGGGGIYQFTPYHKFEPLRSKNWLSAAKQSKFVAKQLNASGGWNPTPSIVGVSFMEFAAMRDPVKAVLKWDGYEKGAIGPIQQTAAARKADAKTAYKIFNGADYKFNKKKVQSWYHPDKGGGVLDTGGSTQNDDNSRDPRCNPDQSQDDDDISSNSIVKTAEKEIKEGRHPSGTKYCKWFGVNVGTPWCAIFVSWVLHHTKGYEYIPKQGSVAGFASYFKGKDQDRSYKSTPKPGWLILFDWDGAHNTGSGNSHIGIVTKVKNGKISTIEGNDADNGDTITKALKNEYSVGDKRISMYAIPHKK